MSDAPEKSTAVPRRAAESPEEPTTVPRCRVCAQPAKTLKCSKCKMPYCSVACQTLDWKERGHKATCKRLVKEAAARDEASTPSPKAAPPVVMGPARGREDVARAKAAAAAANATTAATPEPDHWRGSTRCPVCLENWDVNAMPTILICCCKYVCTPCSKKMDAASFPCPLCRTPEPKSDEEELSILCRHVENDNPVAIRELGCSYTQGDLGLVPSHKKAARLYQRAADLGDFKAMNDLGFAYNHGRGVKLDKKKAVKYYRMAADRNYAAAQSNLGCCFRNGSGVAQDDAEAFRFFKLAADQGHTQAENNLGFMYATGRGVARDKAEAKRWFERAAAKGHEGAKYNLARTRP
jgi:hypothetical protein